ncbi:MAG TPA: DUF131 domain-containing protein [Thermoplasmata archaeon]|nr:DUF131 domain-containing protein [Thermoplasmata archaeon]
MRILPLVAVTALIGGIALLAYSAATGEGQVSLFLIFPVFTGTGLVAFAGMLLITLGFFLGFLSLASRLVPASEKPSEPPTAPPAPSSVAPAKKFGGVVFLGPVPIVFGSDRRISTAMLVLGIVLTVLLALFFFLPRPAP